MKKVFWILAICILQFVSTEFIYASKDATISSKDSSLVNSGLKLGSQHRFNALIGFDLQSKEFIGSATLFLYTPSILLSTVSVVVERVDYEGWDEESATWDNTHNLEPFSSQTLNLIYVGDNLYSLKLNSNWFREAGSRISFRLYSSSPHMFPIEFSSRETINPPYISVSHVSSRSPKSATINFRLLGSSLSDVMVLHYYGTAPDNEGSEFENPPEEGSIELLVGYVNNYTEVVPITKNEVFAFETKTEYDRGPVGTVWFTDDPLGAPVIGIFTSYRLGGGNEEKLCSIKIMDEDKYYFKIPDGSPEGIDCHISEEYEENGILKIVYTFDVGTNNTSLDCYPDDDTITLYDEESASKYSHCQYLKANVGIIGTWVGTGILDQLQLLEGNLTISNQNFNSLKNLNEIHGNVLIENSPNDFLGKGIKVYGSVSIINQGTPLHVCEFLEINGEFYIEGVSYLECPTTKITEYLSIQDFPGPSDFFFNSLVDVFGIRAIGVDYLSFNSLYMTSILEIENSEISFGSLTQVDKVSLKNTYNAGGSFSYLTITESAIFSGFSPEIQTLNCLNEKTCHFEFKDMSELTNLNVKLTGEASLTLSNLISLEAISDETFKYLLVSDLIIQNTGITSMSGFGFKSLRSLKVVDNLELVTLSGLDSLNEVDYVVNITNNGLADEESIKPLKNLTHVGSFYLQLNNKREYLSIVQPCLCSVSGLICDEPLNSYESKIKYYKQVANVKLSIESSQISVYLSRALICSKELSPSNLEEKNLLLDVVDDIALNAEKNHLPQISYKAATFLSSIVQGPHFSSYVPPYTPEYILERAEKHLDFIDGSLRYYDQLGDQKMTADSVTALLSSDFNENAILIKNLDAQYKQIKSEIEKEMQSMNRGLDAMIPLIKDIEVAFQKLSAIVEDNSRQIFEFLKKAFQVSVQVVKAIITFDPMDVVDAVTGFAELAGEAFDFYDSIDQSEYEDFDQIFVSLNSTWDQLGNVFDMIFKLKELMDAEGEIYSVDQYLETKNFSLVADWRSLPIYVDRALSKTCINTGDPEQEELLISCKVFIDTLKILSIYGEDVTELSKSISNMHRQGTLVNAAKYDYLEAGEQLQILERDFETRATAAEEAKVVADRHLANLVTVTVGEIQDFCFAIRYVFPASTQSECNIESVEYSGGSTLLSLQTLFLNVYSAYEMNLRNYLDFQVLNLNGLNITGSVDWELLLSGEKTFFNIDRALFADSYLDQYLRFFKYLEILKLYFFIEGIPNEHLMVLDFTLNPPFIKDDSFSNYTFSMDSYVNNIIGYETVSEGRDCGSRCEPFESDNKKVCICTNADFGVIDSKNYFTRPSLFCKVSLQIKSFRALETVMAEHSIRAQDLSLYMSVDAVGTINTTP